MGRKQCIIKAWRGWIVLIAAAVLLLLSAAAVLLTAQAPVPKETLPVWNEAEGDGYDLELVFYPEQNAFALTERIRFTNRTGEPLREIVLRTWPGAFASEDTSPAAMEDVWDTAYGTAFSAGGIESGGVWIDGSPAGGAFEDTAKTVFTVPVTELAPGDAAELLLRWRITVPDCAYRFGRSGDTWQLGNMIPLISVYENGDWRRDPYWPVGDPFYTACANFAVRIKAPEEYTVLGSMPLKRDGDMLTGRVNGIRDIAFVIKREAVTVRRVSGGVELAAAADTRAEAEKMLKYAENALKVFSNLYGAYPYESFTAVKCGLTSKSTAYPCLVMIDGGCFVNDTVQEQEIARQCAHQWFYGIVGSDPIYQPWQDEGCAEFAVLSYWSERYGRDAGEELRLVWTEEAMKERILSSVTPGSPLDRFADLTEYTAVVYDRGAAFFAACDLMCGGRMNAFLREYCMKCAYENVSRERFNALLNEFAGLDMTPLMLDYLDTLI